MKWAQQQKYWLKNKKITEQELGFKFIRIDPGEEDFA